MNIPIKDINAPKRDNQGRFVGKCKHEPLIKKFKSYELLAGAYCDDCKKGFLRSEVYLLKPTFFCPTCQNDYDLSARQEGTNICIGCFKGKEECEKCKGNEVCQVFEGCFCKCHRLTGMELGVEKYSEHKCCRQPTEKKCCKLCDAYFPGLEGCENSNCSCHKPQPTQQDWSDDLENILRMWQYDFVRENGIKQIKDFIRNLLLKERESYVKELEEWLMKNHVDDGEELIENLLKFIRK